MLKGSAPKVPFNGTKKVAVTKWKSRSDFRADPRTDCKAGIQDATAVLVDEQWTEKPTTQRTSQRMTGKKCYIILGVEPIGFDSKGLRKRGSAMVWS